MTEPHVHDDPPVQPSFAPAILAFGAAFLFAGITMYWLYAAVGALLVTEALRRWTVELIREWRPST